MIARFLLVCLGGAVGTAARYATALAAAAAFGSGFPIGTLIVNVTGSFLIAFVMQLMPPGDLRLVLTAGVMGGFTTYSSFNYESTALFRGGSWGLGALNMTATVIGCLAAGLAGMALARLLMAK
jgi:CrcB protein